MLLYLNLHTDEFDSTVIPYSIATMQYAAGLLAESANIFMLATRSSVEYCITFFVAFHVLASIDNIYAESQVHFKLKEAVEKPLEFKRDSKPYSENKTRVDKAIAFQLQAQGLFYTVYYYFTPFVVNFIPYFSPGNLHHAEH